MSAVSHKPAQAFCRVCGSPGLSALADYPALFRVTSDCRPWKRGGALSVCPVCGVPQKPASEEYEDECRAIYEGYAVYHQGGGKEQRVFDQENQGRSSSRSEFLLERMLERWPLPPSGRLLDIGCGNGSLLRAASRRLPGWRLSGCEISERHRDEVEAIRNLEAFHSCPLIEIPGWFDLISMVHSLEHMADPAGFLREVRELLREGSLLFIHLPDFCQNPFDLVIADHCTHLGFPALERLAASAGLTSLWMDGIVPKELSFMARADGNAPGRSGGPPAGSPSLAPVRRALDWLLAARNQAHALAVEGGLGVFGTSIGGAWLFGELEGSVEFFVDEDENRQGRTFLDRPVLKPQKVPEGSRVFVPLAPSVARDVCRRFSRGPGAYLAPFGGVAQGCF